MKIYSNLRVPWHTHLYRAGLAVFVKSDRPWHAYVFRSWQSLNGNPRYSPPSPEKVLHDTLLTGLQSLLHELRSPRAPAELAAALVELGRLRNRTDKTVARHLANLNVPDDPVATSYAFNHVVESLRPATAKRSSDILVYTVAVGEDYRQSVAPCLASHAAYCEKNGYGYAELESIDIPLKRPVSWYKIPLGLHLLKLGYRHVFHIDADCLITNHDFKLETLVGKLDRPRNPGAMLITEDECGINCGCFLLRNTPGAARLLDSVWLYDAEVSHPNWEQEAFKRLIADHEEFLGIVVIEKNRKLFNSMPRERMASKQPALTAMNDWTPGDFLCHFAGIQKSDRDRLIAQYSSGAQKP